MDQAIAKLTSGAADFDVFFPTPDRISRLAFGKILQPLNNDYIPNLKNVWPALQDPFYDRGSQYTVPYTVYTTGIGYRTDHVKTTPGELSNPYDIYWDETLARGRRSCSTTRARRSRWRCSGTGSRISTRRAPDQIEAAKNELIDLNNSVNVKLSALDYVKLPEGQAWLHQAWSGSMIAAPGYLPSGTDASVLGYWYPPDGGGAIGSDAIAVLRSAKNPVLAHLFLDFMLDEKIAYSNFAGFNGYQPPLNSLNPDRLVADGVVPANLRIGRGRGVGLQERPPGAGAQPGRADPVAERLGGVLRRRVAVPG